MSDTSLGRAGSDRRTRLARAAVAALAGCLALIIPGVGPLGVVKMLVAAGVLLLMPGVAALLGPLAAARLDVAQRLVVALGVSIAVDVLLMLMLDRLPIGITGNTMVLAVTLVSVAAVVFTPASAPARPAFGMSRLRQRWRGTAMLAAAVAVVTLSVAASVLNTDASRQAFTTLSAIPAAGQGNSKNAQVEIVNHEGHAQRYQLRLERGSVVVASWTDIEVPSEGRWSTTARLPADASAQAVVGLLYRADALGVPYRRVVLWP
jgi:uncharacterized membrane protein